MLELQRLAGNASVSQLVARSAANADEQEEDAGPSPVLDIVGKSGGEPLPDALRGDMEARLGADFGGVRVHHDAAASASADSVGAHAYTVGNDVVFRSDQWDPSSDSGRRTLAHELSHVVQQANGEVSGTPAPGGIRVSSPSDSFERAADRTADAAMAQPAPGPAGGASLAAGAGLTAQREAAAPGIEDEELEDDQLEARAIAVQREALQAEGNRPGPPEEEELGEGDEIAPPEQSAPGPDEELPDEEELKRQQQQG
jgi:hypothetical protein